MGKNYLYISDSYDGWRNLATDEWFLDHIGPEDVVLYFYINRNAVIIGKNQNPWKECDLSAWNGMEFSWCVGSAAEERSFTTAGI